MKESVAELLQLVGGSRSDAGAGAERFNGPPK